MSDKILELEKKILEHKKYYYEGNPKISDEEFDQLEAELRDLAPSSEVLLMVGHVSKNLAKVSHEKKMLSLDKKYELEELINWVNDRAIVGTKKIDGVSCSLIYEYGKFIQGKTRGNGSIGEDITQKCHWIKSIPKIVVTELERLEIRGEIYCDLNKFNDLSEKMVALGEDKPTSPRNIVAGLIGRKEKIYLNEYLDFQAFDLVEKYEVFSYECDIFDFLNRCTFKTPDYKLIRTNKELISFLDDIKLFSLHGNYQIDGAVLTLNEIGLHDELGETAHHPRYKMAFKFKSEGKEALLKEIEWNISRNGIFTPVGIIQPIELSGAMVSRVTLHNFGNVLKHNLKSGDRIKVVRSGEVIPKFESVIHSTHNEFKYPKKCNYCSTELKVEDIRLFCRNVECPGILKFEILNFISKIGIDDLSEKRLDSLMEHKLVSGISDLYTLTENDLLQLPKTKNTLAMKLISSIQKSKKTTLPIFLSALGLNGGALNKCEKIVQSGFNSVEKILAIDVENLVKIEGFAEKSASEIINSLRQKELLIRELVKLGFEFKKELVVSGGKLDGLNVCVTGKLSKPRSTIQKDIKLNGGIVSSGVSKNTTYLICNDINSGSSKVKNAQKHNVTILSEDEFYQIIE